LPRRAGKSSRLRNRAVCGDLASRDFPDRYADFVEHRKSFSRKDAEHAKNTKKFLGELSAFA